MNVGGSLSYGKAGCEDLHTHKLSTVRAQIMAVRKTLGAMIAEKPLLGKGD
jgi:hypothetical protein